MVDDVIAWSFLYTLGYNPRNTKCHTWFGFELRTELADEQLAF